MPRLPPRPHLSHRHAPWLAAWLALSLAGGAALARHELGQLREAFDTDARIVHRLLSQRVVQHDAILATLALLQPAGSEAAAGQRPEQRLSSVYPQILQVQRRSSDASGDAAWADPALARAETLSRALRRPALASVDFARGRYELVLASAPASYAMVLDLRAVIPWAEWPMAAQTSPVRVTLDQDGQQFVVQPGDTKPAASGWRFEAHKHLAADSQPFDVVASRQVGWADLPWGWMLGWAVGVAVALSALLALQRQRAERRRAEELLRLGQVARLNTLGELAAGMAHELNQPLTAVLANTQAAARLLADVEVTPESDTDALPTARHAMGQAVEQARRASGVVARLRRAVERPDMAAAPVAVDLQAVVGDALYLLEPEFQRRGVDTQLLPSPTPVVVLAEPVALEQIVHNLIMNALQAMAQVPAGERRLTLGWQAGPSQGLLQVADSGPGIAPDVLPRIFEPFFTTRAGDGTATGGGLGLGLSLCETLATNMGGSLTAANQAPRGAVFALALPLAGRAA